MNWPLFISTFTLIFLAELPDKTALATVIMATRGRAVAVFVGTALAFLVQTIVAALFGSVFGLLPEHWVHLGVGILFLLFAAHSFYKLGSAETEDEEFVTNASLGFWFCAWRSFLVIFIAEWGDLTQIATASLLAKYHENPWTVFLAALLALWAVTFLAVVIGQKAAQFIKPVLIQKIGIVIFTLIGLYFIYTWVHA